ARGWGAVPGDHGQRRRGAPARLRGDRLHDLPRVDAPERHVRRDPRAHRGGEAEGPRGRRVVVSARVRRLEGRRDRDRRRRVRGADRLPARRPRREGEAADGAHRAGGREEGLREGAHSDRDSRGARAPRRAERVRRPPDRDLLGRRSEGDVGDLRRGARHPRRRRLRLDHRPQFLSAPEEGRPRVPRPGDGHLRGEDEVSAVESPSSESLSREFLRVSEEAAIDAARTMGKGQRKHSDHVAVEAMRKAMDSLPMRGTVVIGEGERDEAPMLYIGEKVGRGAAGDIEVDIAVDPLEGTNLCATGSPGAIAVLAASNKGGLLHAPDCYMEKIVVGPAAKDAIDLDAPVEDNLKAIARCLGRAVRDLVVIVLDRERHEKLIGDIRKAGARIRLISDGDLSAGITAAVRRTNVHAVMGIGGAPEGVLTAAALRCLNGGMRARLVPTKPGQEERMRKMGITDPKRIYTEKDLAPGPDILFAATGVTDGTLMRGVRFFGGGIRTSSVLMANRRRMIRFVDTVHLEDDHQTVIEF